MHKEGASSGGKVRAPGIFLAAAGGERPRKVVQR